MKLTSDDILDILDQQDECEWLDFKEKYYAPENKADMAHDLLCMVNAHCDSDRYILLGVSDDKTVVGIDQPLSDNSFSTDIRAFPFNRSLPVSYYELDLFTQEEDVRIGIIHIRQAQHQPYCLTKDFEKRGKRVRAGVVYTRNGSNNTPIDGTAHELEIERMWRDRFGLNLPPSARVEALIKETNKWVTADSPSDQFGNVRYYNDAPEYTLEIQSRDDEPRDFYEPWMAPITDSFEKSQAQQTGVWSYYIKYHTTILRSGILMWVRHTLMPFPSTKSASEYEKDSQDMEYILKLDTFDYFVSAICVSDSYSYDPTAQDKLALFDYRVLEDTTVMFGSSPFELERRKKGWQ